MFLPHTCGKFSLYLYSSLFFPLIFPYNLRFFLLFFLLFSVCLNWILFFFSYFQLFLSIIHPLTDACSVYNLLAIPASAGLFFPLFHLQLPPYICAAAMALSSSTVIGSSLLLRRYCYSTSVFIRSSYYRLFLHPFLLYCASIPSIPFCSVHGDTSILAITMCKIVGLSVSFYLRLLYLFLSRV